jgi:L-fuculose-phosphate aldolase
LVRTAELGAALACAIGDGPGCLIPNHGLVTVGASVAEAVMGAVVLERACKVQLAAMAAGGPQVWSDKEEVELKQREVWTPEQISAGFDYLCRAADAGRS